MDFTHIVNVFEDTRIIYAMSGCATMHAQVTFALKTSKKKKKKGGNKEEIRDKKERGRRIEERRR